MACKLVGSLGLLLQGTVAAAFGAALLGKYFIERSEQPNPRPLFVYAMDCSKQVMGAAWVHLLNLVFAGVLANVSTRGDQCIWFWLNLMLDTTLGVLVEYIILQGINSLIAAICKNLLKKPHYANDWIESGEYFDVDRNFKVQRYLKQLFVWVVIIVSGMKASMVGLMLIFNIHLEQLAELVLYPCMQDETTKLIVVTVITPGIMNAVQFWIVDNIIHRKPSARELLRIQLQELDSRYQALLGEPTTHFQQQGGERLTIQELQEGLALMTTMVRNHDMQLKKVPPSEELHREVTEIRNILLPHVSETLPKMEATLHNHNKLFKELEEKIAQMQNTPPGHHSQLPAPQQTQVVTGNELSL